MSAEEFKEPFRQLWLLRRQRDQDKAAADRSERAYRAAESELFDALQEAGIRGRHTFDFGPELGSVSFTRRSTKRGRVLDKSTAIEALRREGLEHIVSVENVAMKRLNELVRDRLESKDDLPEGIDWYSDDGITISAK